MKRALATVAATIVMLWGETAAHAQASVGYEAEPPLALKNLSALSWKTFESFSIAAER